MCLPSCHAICLQGTNSKMARRMAGECPSATMMVPGCTSNNNINNSNTISNNNSINNSTNSISEGPDLPEQRSSSSFSSSSSKMASELQSFPAPLR